MHACSWRITMMIPIRDLASKLFGDNHDLHKTEWPAQTRLFSTQVFSECADSRQNTILSEGWAQQRVKTLHPVSLPSSPLPRSCCTRRDSRVPPIRYWGHFRDWMIQMHNNYMQSSTSWLNQPLLDRKHWKGVISLLFTWRLCLQLLFALASFLCWDGTLGERDGAEGYLGCCDGIAPKKVGAELLAQIMQLQRTIRWYLVKNHQTIQTWFCARYTFTVMEINAWLGLITTRSLSSWVQFLAARDILHSTNNLGASMAHQFPDPGFLSFLSALCWCCHLLQQTLDSLQSQCRISFAWRLTLLGISAVMFCCSLDCSLDCYSL